jgi:hypothetical protein
MCMGMGSSFGVANQQRLNRIEATGQARAALVPLLPLLHLDAGCHPIFHAAAI